MVRSLLPVISTRTAKLFKECLFLPYLKELTRFWVDSSFSPLTKRMLCEFVLSCRSLHYANIQIFTFSFCKTKKAGIPIRWRVQFLNSNMSWFQMNVRWIQTFVYASIWIHVESYRIISPESLQHNHSYTHECIQHTNAHTYRTHLCPEDEGLITQLEERRAR